MRRMIYVVTGDQQTASMVSQDLTGGGYACELFSDAREVLAALKGQLPDLFSGQPPDLLIIDFELPDANGLDVLKKVRRIAPALPLIMMAERVSLAVALAALKQGATDFLESPREHGRALVVARHALETTELQRERRHAGGELHDPHKMVGESLGMKRLWSHIRRVAPTAASVLVTGESGVGKELVARAVHRHSPRASGPFVPLNCAAIPKDIIESELFGHEKGAFTGASVARAGKIQEADGGTLFLDEIGDLSLPAQAKLLRFLNDSEIQRVGASGAVHLDARVVAATNKDLQKLIKQDAYREDLYHRLNVVTIEVPPLRERASDIEPVASFFAERFCAKHGRSVSFSAESWLALKTYSWPGNIRELRNLIERVVIMAETNPVEVDELRSLLGVAPQVRTDGVLKAALEHTERQTVLDVLARTSYDVAEAAAVLGIVRSSLYRIMRRYGIPSPVRTSTKGRPPRSRAESCLDWENSCVPKETTRG